MTQNELKANLSAAHLIGHIQFYLTEAMKKNNKHEAIMHLKALIRACELNESNDTFKKWKDNYENQLENYE